MNDLGERSETGLMASRATLIQIGPEAAGQRIDNFLLRLARGVPKSHVYRVIRGGEVRVNRRRIDVTYRLQEGDQVRLPPMRTSTPPRTAPATPAIFPTVYEDDALIVLDKPAGVAVHGGSGVAFGVVEQLRAGARPGAFLELVHRLDRDTSGLLMLAKKRAALVGVQDQIRAGAIEKRYLALVHGAWPNARQHVRAPLLRYLLPDGERRVRVDPAGLLAHSIVTLKERYDRYSLLEVQLVTGRTHQIRVHLAHLGYPIVGDDKYGDYAANRELARPGPHQFKRMFLHAASLKLVHPTTHVPLSLAAPLPPECLVFLEGLNRA